MSEESRIRELAESIRTKCAQTQQARQQGAPIATPAAVQAEVRSRLKEVIVRLQDDIRDPSLSGVQQRLQYTASKFGLTFQRSATGICCYLSSESFYIEVSLDENGLVQSANVVLGQETQQNTGVLVKLLRQHKYTKFEKHVKSLVDMFGQASGQEASLLLLKVIFATENILISINSSTANPVDSILRNHLGLITPRKGGLPMKLTFFITPLEAMRHGLLHDPNPGSDVASELDVGVSATVRVERSAQLYRLTVDPNLFNRSQGSFNSITEQNSVSVPLTLVLCLSEDIPACVAITEKLQHTVYGSVQSMAPVSPLHIDQLILSEAIAKDNSTSSIPTGTTRHTIYLTGQVHEYTGIGEVKEFPNSYRGVLLPNRKIPFTHPVHVINIIRLLRQQLVYNTLLKSCLSRRNSASVATESQLRQLEDYSFHVTTQPPEIIAMTTQLLTIKGGVTPLRIEFVVPHENGLLPVQPMIRLQINDIIEQSQILNGVLAKCFSIPVTLHAALSRPGKLLPPSVAAAVQAHQETLRQFEHELSSCDNALSCDNHMELSVEQFSNATGNKRKRTV